MTATDGQDDAMQETERRVREAFRDQARHCRALGSPFTATLCDLLAERLRENSSLGARLLGWPGNPGSAHDAVPLRLAAGLHALTFQENDSAWSAIYPPASAVSSETLSRELDRVLDVHGSDLLRWLDLPPQTNEVGRAAVLMAGLLFRAETHRLPFSLYELGSSGGLNLNLDRYRYTLGTTEVGVESAVHLKPTWIGPSPTPAKIQIAARRGVDRAPIDISTAFGRERLMAYVWPDQIERLNRIRNALDIAGTAPPRVDMMDAADWLELKVMPTPVPGLHRVLMHSVTFQYFSAETQRRVTARAEQVGAGATAEAPFSWLRMEHTNDGICELRVCLWPGGRDLLLATAHAHGTAIEWVVNEGPP